MAEGRRADTYREFLAVAGAKLQVLGDYFDYHYHYHYHGDELPEDFVVAVFDQVGNVSLFGSERAGELAGAAADSLRSLLGSTERESNETYRTARERIDAFGLEARTDIQDR